MSEEQRRRQREAAQQYARNEEASERSLNFSRYGAVVSPFDSYETTPPTGLETFEQQILMPPAALDDGPMLQGDWLGEEPEIDGELNAAADLGRAGLPPELDHPQPRPGPNAERNEPERRPPRRLEL